MSKYWGYRCTKDGAMSDTWFNRGEHILRNCVQCWPLIKEIRRKNSSGYIEVHILGHGHCDSEVWDFLEEHYEHGLELLNEYGGTEPM